MSRLLPVVVFLAATGFIAFSFLRPGAPPVVVSDAVAVPQTDWSQMAVYVTLLNQGPPLTLASARGPDGTQADLMGATGPLALPGGGEALMAADGAHILLTGVGTDATDGALLPLALLTGDGREIEVRARVEAPATEGMAMHGLGGMAEVAAEEAPRLSLSVEAHETGWFLTLDIANFRMTQVPMGTAHVPGEGHAHLYLNGLKLARLYGTETRIGPLPPGDHLVSVTLNTHDHRPYATGGAPIRAEAMIEAR